MKQIQKHKQLQTQLNKLNGDVDALKIEIQHKQKECSQKQKLIENLKIEMSKLENNQELKVSEHAIIRYFERVKGYDISEIEKEILSQEVINLTEQLGVNGNFPNKDFTVVMKNSTVITIIK